MLVRVSAGYLPARGWLHTCDSPVRRSPAKYCYSPLPLDLHVLSLSLAFILSQDQTLHTNIIFTELFFWPGHVVYRDFRHFDSRSLLVHLNILKNSSSIVALFSKAGAKVRLFFHPPNFFKFFSIFFSASQLLQSLYPRSPSLSKAGAKIRQTFPLFQIFSQVFLMFF